jgi:HEAT repeat protein
VFISWAHEDHAFNRLLRDAFDKAGIQYWVDLKDLEPGTYNWQLAIREAIKNCDKVILIASPNAGGSHYVSVEIAVADDHKKTIIPAWVTGELYSECVPLGVVMTQAVDLRDIRFDTGLGKLVAMLGGKESEPPIDTSRKPDLPTIEKNPYMGLRYFSDREADRYFGREVLVDELVERVRRRMDGERERFLAIIAPSGAGKSSLVLAGLLPSLRLNAIPGSENWTYLERMVPGSAPVRALADKLNTAISSMTARMIDDKLKTARGLAELVEKIPQKPVVLFIDQFEELFSASIGEEERTHFLHLLTVACEQPGNPLFIVLTMRGDFYALPMNYADFGRLVQNNNISVLAMSFSDLSRAIALPAAAAGLTLDDGLVSEIVLDLTDPRHKRTLAGALPLLQYTLDRLYEERDGQRLTLAAYHGMGGVHGAIGKHADDVFESLAEAERDAFGRVFSRLVQISDESIPTRKRAALASWESEEDARKHIEALVDARLLVSDEQEGEATIEVAHEALLEKWTALIAWIGQHGEDLRVIDEMRQRAAVWDKNGQPKDGHLSHAEEKRARHAVENLGAALNEVETAFLRPKAERLLEEFKRAPASHKPGLIEREFAPLGEDACEALVLAYGHNDGYPMEYDTRPTIRQLLWAMKPDTIQREVLKALTNPDARSRAGAVSLCDRFRLTQLLTHLIPLLQDSDSDVRRASAQALGQLGDTTAVAHLIPLLQDSDSDVRQVAAQALGQLGDTTAVAPLIPLLQDRDSVRRVVAQALGQLGDTTAVSHLIRQLKVIFSDVRQAAAQALGQLGDTSAVAHLIPLLQDSDWDVRRAAARALGQIGDTTAVAPLIPLLQDSVSNIQETAARALGQIGDTRAVSHLIPLLRDSDSRVQAAATASLGQLGDTTAVPRLIPLLQNGNPHVQPKAAEALGQLGDTSAVAHLIPLLQVRYSDARRAAAEALGQLGDTSAVAHLIPLLQDRDSDVRRAAAAALGQLGGTTAVPSLIPLLQDSDSLVQAAAAVALGRFGDVSAVTALVPLLQDIREDSRSAAADALGALKVDSAVPEIAALLSHPFGGVSDAARRALVAMDTEASRAALADYDGATGA